MKVARILYPVQVLGPGKRIAIWVAGCNRACKGCANPELWEAKEEQEISVENLMFLIDSLFQKADGVVDGFTITGGEPFDQAEELLELVRFMRKKADDILIFSGYQKEELEANRNTAQILDEISVLVDGPYMEEKNVGEVLRGSRNQQIHFLQENQRNRYEAYLTEYSDKHLVENFRTADGVISVGIHKKDFKEKLEEKLENREIILKEKGTNNG